MQITTDYGTIQVSNEAVAAVAGSAASKCFGVKGMTVTSVKDGLVHLLKREAMTKGVKIAQDEEGKLVVELHIAMDSEINILEACRSIINEVNYQVEKCTGIPVSAVNVFVESIKVS